MTEIIYTPTDGYGEISEFSGTRGGPIKIKIKGVDSGTLHLGDRVYRVDCGEATLEPSRLSDGDYSPLFVDKSGTLELEGFRRFGREILPLPTSERLLRRLLCRVRTLEDRLANAEAKIETLEDGVSRKITF